MLQDGGKTQFIHAKSSDGYNNTNACIPTISFFRCFLIQQLAYAMKSGSDDINGTFQWFGERKGLRCSEEKNTVVNQNSNSKFVEKHTFLLPRRITSV